MQILMIIDNKQVLKGQYGIMTFTEVIGHGGSFPAPDKLRLVFSVHHHQSSIAEEPFFLTA